MAPCERGVRRTDAGAISGIRIPDDCRCCAAVTSQPQGSDPALVARLAHLYLCQGLSTYRIADVTGQDRRTIPAAVLRELYSRAGLTADEVGSKLGTSRKIVLRSAHDLGLPVRLGGPRHQPDFGEIELIRALYADTVVAAALIRHKIPRVPPGGSIWERFPEPVPLSRHLVEDLYWHCGVALNHVELLTGQPAHTVRGFMSRAGIAVRHPGGRSPFIRRWQAPGNRRPDART
jgi:hypothetical protein